MLKGVIYSDLLKDTMIGIDLYWDKTNGTYTESEILLPQLIDSIDDQNIVYYNDFI